MGNMYDMEPVSSKKLSKKEEEEMLVEWNKNRSKKSSTNYIKIDNRATDKAGDANPDYGKIVVNTAGEDGDELSYVELNETEFFLIRSRVMVKCDKYIPNPKAPGKQMAAYFCREVDKFENIEIVDATNEEVVYSGAYKHIPKNDKGERVYPMKYQVAWYVVLEDKIYRWLFPPSCRDSVFEIERALLEIKHPMTLKVAKLEKQSKGSNFFWVPTFEVANEYPVDAAFHYTKGLAQILDEYYTNIEKEDESTEESTVEEVKEEKPTEDLPFS